MQNISIEMRKCFLLIIKGNIPVFLPLFSLNILAK